MNQRRLTKGDVIRKCIVIIEGLRRAFSQGNAGLEAQPGYEEEFWVSDEMLRTLREMLREMERGGKPQEDGTREWQRQLMEAGGPPKELEI